MSPKRHTTTTEMLILHSHAAARELVRVLLKGRPWDYDFFLLISVYNAGRLLRCHSSWTATAPHRGKDGVHVVWTDGIFWTPLEARSSQDTRKGSEGGIYDYGVILAVQGVNCDRAYGHGSEF